MNNTASDECHGPYRRWREEASDSIAVRHSFSPCPNISDIPVIYTGCTARRIRTGIKREAPNLLPHEPHMLPFNTAARPDFSKRDKRKTTMNFGRFSQQQQLRVFLTQIPRRGYITLATTQTAEDAVCFLPCCQRSRRPRKGARPDR